MGQETWGCAGRVGDLRLLFYPGETWPSAFLSKCVGSGVIRGFAGARHRGSRGAGL